MSDRTPSLSFLRFALAALALAWAAPAPAHEEGDPYPRDHELRVNHIQSIGTHNSYHLRSTLYPNGPPFDFDYEHAPLAVQLDEQGVRKFELDVYWDADLELFRVHHENFFDQNSSCPTLAECLEILRAWSLAHRGHGPIVVFVEPKGIYYPTSFSDEPICDPPDYVVCHYDELDAEIRFALAPPGGPDLLMTPDEVRGARATLRDAILLDGWPPLGQARGRFLFVLLGGGVDRDNYAAGTPLLAGRAMFTSSAPDREDAAVMMRDDPEGSFAQIQDLVAQGYVIRTRADALSDAQAGDTTRRDAAFASGSQVISTDYPAPGMLENGYFASIPGGTPSRCNPVSTIGLECTPHDIEDPAFLAPEPHGAAGAAAALATLLGVTVARRRTGVRR